MAETELHTGIVATPSGLIARIERRLDQSRRFGRDVDGLFKQLVLTLIADWPSDPAERLELALRAFVGASQWAEQAEQPTRAIRVTAEMALTHAYHAIIALGDAAAAQAEAIVDAWAWSVTVPRPQVTDVVLDAASPLALKAIEALVMRRGHRLRHNVAELLDPLQRVAQGSASAREFTLFHARIVSRTGRLEAALDLLADEPVSDPRVPLVYADIYCEHGQVDEAVERLRRGLVVAPDKRVVRERLLDLYLDKGDIDEAVEQLMRMLHETGEAFYWELLGDLLAVIDPARLARTHDSLAEAAPALHLEILMSQGALDEVADASRAKTFSAEQLWRIGDFLAEHGSRKAARVYERAINLQGAVAQSKLECGDLGARIEAVIPFFASIERPTKLQRLAKELMAKNKNNIPMRREFERIFGPGFK